MSDKYGKLKRHDLKLLIESLYGLEVRSMQEGDRGILVYTDKGIRRLKEIKSDEAKILFAASAYEHIYNNGFRRISRINRNLDGGFHIRYDKNNYILQDFTGGRVLDVDSEKKAADAGKALAELHRAGEHFIPVTGSRARVNWGKWMQKFKANSISLKKFKEITLQKEIKSRFDHLLIQHMDGFIGSMQRSYILLKENGYLEKVRQSMECNQIVHGEFKKHAMFEEETGDIFITNLEECSYDICESDLATLFESFSGRHRLELVAAAAEAYAGVKPLDKSSIMITAAFLLCPRRFFKVAESACGRRKNYNEIELLRKLERSLKREKKKQETAEFIAALV